MNALIRWFVGNPVAANLLMLFIVVGGLVGGTVVNKTVFPAAALDRITVSVPYPGATPADVEERILIPVEEAISGLQGVRRIRANGFEGRGQVVIEALEGYDVEQLLNQVKGRVDAINTFPATMERPVVSRSFQQSEVMYLLLHGAIGEQELKELGRSVRDRIAALPGAEKTRLEGDRSYEISVEVSELQLDQFGLTFSDVAQAIRRASLNVGAGLVDDPSGQTQLMTRGQGYVGSDFHDIVIARQSDGNRILLRDVASVVDGFSDGEVAFHYNNSPTLLLTVIAGENPDVISLSAEVHKLLAEEIRPSLPEGVSIDILIDESDSFRDRLALLAKNGISGLLLVFAGLALFLTPRLALWVCAGICISFLGCFWLMPYMGIELTMLSTFALVLILGIVVDDAVIISESIHRQHELGIAGVEGAVAGATMVAKPVIFSAITTMLAFSPLLFLEGETRAFVIAIPLVVIATLMFSLLESLCILPSHLVRELAVEKREGKLSVWFSVIRMHADKAMQFVIRKLYRPVLDRSLRHIWLTLSVFVACSFLVLSFVLGGWLKFSFEPNVVADFIQVNLQFPAGAPYSTKRLVQAKLENAADQLKTQLAELNPGEEIIKGVATWTFSQSDQVQAFMSVRSNASQGATVESIAGRWRELTGDLPDVSDSKFAFTVNDNEPALYLVVAGNDTTALEGAAEQLKTKLRAYEAVFEVVDSSDSASTEAQLSLRPGAENLGISLTDLATQVRQAFYGEEVQRVPRGRDSVKVMVRLPHEDRSKVDTLNDLRIRTGNGTTVPFAMVADVEYSAAMTRVSRTDRERTILVTAKLDTQTGNAGDIKQSLEAGYLDDLRAQFPQLSVYWAGSQENQSEFMSSIGRNSLFALFAIYFLLAVAFRSYLQPIIIMTAIPFGYLGAVVGHLLLGLDLSLYSILGIVAAAGVVINDNLVLMDYINKLKAQGETAIRAIERAAEDRFRPIFLTSFTTFIGLIPLMAETSVQAQFMIPTVVSLAFGVLFASFVTLILVPICYLLLERWTLLWGEVQPVWKSRKALQIK